MFGSEPVVGGDASKQQGRFSNGLPDARQQVDYEFVLPQVDTAELLDRTERFVEETERLATES